MKNFCVSDIPMESVTLDDMSTMFAEIDERVRRAHSLEEVVPILRESYYRLRTRVLEDYITKEMENKPIEAKPDANKLDGIPVEVCPDESVTSYYKPDSSTNAYNTSDMPTTPIPRPAEVPKEFCKSRADGKVQPGEIIYLNLDGHWRPYRVMANVDGATRLLGLFSIGETNKTEPQYLGSLSSQYCDNWCRDIVNRGQNIENHLKLSKMGTLAFYVHIPDWKELQADCKTIAGDLTSAWYNDDDQSNIRVYTDHIGMTSILNGEDGELYEFHSANSEDNEGCFPFEVRPSLTLRLGSLPYYYDPADRAVLEEFF